MRPIRDATTPNEPLLIAMDKDPLIESHLYLVEKIAKRMKYRLPRYIQLGDLVSEGAIGLIGAARTFDPNGGRQFKDHAYQRITGAILDYLRDLHWCSRRSLGQCRARGVEPVKQISAEQVPVEVAGIVDGRMPRPGTNLQRQMAIDMICRSLSDRHRRLFVGYWFDQQPMKALGASIGVSESRACQILGEINARLSVRFTESQLREELEAA
jgi:RNA polymerase sigma factor for flagellar operon FliA